MNNMNINEHDSILESYFAVLEGSQVVEEQELLNESLFSDTKNLYKFNKKIREKMIDYKSAYKYFYITLHNYQTKSTSTAYGNYTSYSTTNVTDHCTLRLYASNEKLTTNDFYRGKIKGQYKKVSKKILKKSTLHSFIEKNDLDADLRKYVIFVDKKKVV